MNELDLVLLFVGIMIIRALLSYSSSSKKRRSSRTHTAGAFDGESDAGGGDGGGGFGGFGGDGGFGGGDGGGGGE